MAREPEHIVNRRRILGEQLAGLRRSRRLRQEDLGRATYCDRSSVAHIERGTARAEIRFWTQADAYLEANGALVAGFRELDAAKRQYEIEVQEAKLAELKAKGRYEETDSSADAPLSVPLPMPTAPSEHEAVGATAGTLTSAAGVRVPDELAALLAANLALFAATAPGTSSHGGDAREQLGEFVRSVVDLVKRRGVLQALGWAATTGLTSPVLDGVHALGLNADEQERVAGVVASPGRVDEKVIEHIENSLWIARRHDDKLGPQAVLDIVLAQQNFIRSLLPECSEQLRPKLLTAFSDAMRTAGWLSFNADDFTSAKHYYEQAYELAHEAHNVELASYVLCNLSHAASWVGRNRAALDHAIAAQLWAQKTDNILLQASGHDRAARAYAADGQYDEFMRAFEQAETCLASFNGKPPTIPHSYDAATLASIRGECLLRLGRTREAIQVSNECLVRMDPSVVRAVALTNLDLGKAYIQSKEIDEAAKVLANAADLTARNRAPRLMKELRTTRAEMQPWQETKAVKELDERLVGCGLA